MTSGMLSSVVPALVYTILHSLSTRAGPFTLLCCGTEGSAKGAKRGKQQRCCLTSHIYALRSLPPALSQSRIRGESHCSDEQLPQVHACENPRRASMEDWKTRLTMAAMMATEPWWQGRRKCTVSTEAVTTGPRATVLAARPAQMSIQLSTCREHKDAQHPQSLSTSAAAASTREARPDLCRFQGSLAPARNRRMLSTLPAPRIRLLQLAQERPGPPEACQAQDLLVLSCFPEAVSSYSWRIKQQGNGEAGRIARRCPMVYACCLAGANAVASCFASEADAGEDEGSTILLGRGSTCPPKQIPKESTSAGRTIWCMTTREAAIDTISSFPSSCRGQLAGSTTLPCMRAVGFCNWSYCLQLYLPIMCEGYSSALFAGI